MTDNIDGRFGAPRSYLTPTLKAGLRPGNAFAGGEAILDKTRFFRNAARYCYEGDGGRIMERIIGRYCLVSRGAVPLTTRRCKAYSPRPSARGFAMAQRGMTS